LWLACRLAWCGLVSVTPKPDAEVIRADFGWVESGFPGRFG
jgi:hypothetical protein